MSVFHDGMEQLARTSSSLVLDAVDFTPGDLVIDIAGGRGGFLLQAMRRRDDIRGVLVDRPEILAQHRLGDLGADQRWDAVEGDFFESVPTGGDVYVLQYVLHDWSDDGALTILRNVAAAMRPGARLLIIDTVLDSPPADGTDTALAGAGVLMDIFMLLTLSGRERSLAELRKLVADAGLTWVGLTPLLAPVALVEVRR